MQCWNKAADRDMGVIDDVEHLLFFSEVLPAIYFLVQWPAYQSKAFCSPGWQIYLEGLEKSHSPGRNHVEVKAFQYNNNLLSVWFRHLCRWFINWPPASAYHLLSVQTGDSIACSEIQFFMTLFYTLSMKQRWNWDVKATWKETKPPWW